MNDEDVKPQLLSDREMGEVKDLIRPRAAVLYEVVRKEGDQELSRTFGALWWSGVAAGLSLGFSPLLQATLMAILPETGALASLVVPAGYTIGFLIVVLARQQLFTENTITAVLPLMAEKTWTNLHRTARLWFIVLCANLAGTLVFTLFIVYSGALSGDVLAAIQDLAQHVMHKSVSEIFFGAILAGWLIAAMVWLMPSCEGLEFWVILFITYVIALLGASHVIAGSVEAYVAVMSGQTPLYEALVFFFLPTLVGNIIGGTAMFALISYAQVYREVPSR